MSNFKHSISKLSLIVLTSLTVAACGSGGGGSGTPTPVVNTGAVFSVSEKGAVSKTSINSNSNLKALDISGHKINLLEDSDSYSFIGENNSLYQYGYLSSKTEDFPNDQVFYNGEIAKNIPNAGEVRYSGSVVIGGQKSDGAPIGASEQLTKGKAEIRADFGSKKLDGRFIFGPGTLERKDMSADSQVINMNATISNNSFEGKATSKHLSGEAAVEGKFYGNNAEALAGAFHRSGEKPWYGAFGAKKDDSAKPNP
ncbi:transferrin-binding protein-like solute binding protein [Aggregatibacter actinomycetemcomitans]|uniref:Slam-dependent surface lipoprotein n=1 Tax=Aggregatibacter actinomycetemcomitans TaxID=714 RepID=UPI00197BFB90|nr:Slam-dependent surface lipoprotein [Aggregatibacter actinomycetemcomitans]MBN6069255.1 transferrin-binding protein-like solute binding protein [Aggregatibacter actinomycetemcomitans]MBN6085561.1 transferrin-binding protein-like solute binding protein [Aggregatibacter actinomycetemcomitans]